MFKFLKELFNSNSSASPNLIEQRKPEATPTQNPEEFVCHTFLPYNVTIIFIHTANKNKRNICFMSLMIVENSTIKYKSFYIKPNTKSFSMLDYNGLSLDTIMSAPTLSEIWASILPYITDKNIAVYYAPFQLESLQKALEYSHIEFPNMKSFTDLYDITTKLWPRLTSHSLDNIGDKFGLSYNPKDVSTGQNICNELLEYIFDHRPKLLNYLTK